MHTEEMFSKLRDSIIDFKTDEIGEIAKEAMDAGISPFDIITQGMSKGMEIIGRRFERQEAWLADLIMAGETMRVRMEGLKARSREESREESGSCCNRYSEGRHSRHRKEHH